jgi:uncharacterized membrane protein YhaH (DUF805 family)
MDFQTAVRTGLAKYVDFTGRAARSEYWWFVLFQALAVVAAGILDIFIGFLQPLVILGLILPGIAVTVRRLHDTDRSGWWFLISLVPLVGFVVLLVFLVTRGTDGENRFGAVADAA